MINIIHTLSLKDESLRARKKYVERQHHLHDSELTVVLSNYNRMSWKKACGNFCTNCKCLMYQLLSANCHFIVTKNADLNFSSSTCRRLVVLEDGCINQSKTTLRTDKIHDFLGIDIILVIYYQLQLYEWRVSFFYLCVITEYIVRKSCTSFNIRLLSRIENDIILRIYVPLQNPLCAIS